MPYYVTTISLLSGIFFLLCLCFITFNSNIKCRYVLIKAEKDETERKLKAKEALTARAQLESNEILSDLRKKEKELEKKSNETEKLISDINALEKQIVLYTQKIDAHEITNGKQQDQAKDNSRLNLIIIDDIIKLINKKLHGKEAYIKLLKLIDAQFISTLKSVYRGNFSVHYLKYCVCFAIGMEIGEVSECFSIEPSSVHMVRYRLKKKFGLGNQDDLDIFLRRLSV